MSSGTKKPCPACKKAPEWKRPTEGVCKACANLLEWARLEKERQESKAASGLQLIRTPRYWASLRGHLNFGDRFKVGEADHHYHDAYGPLSELLHALSPEIQPTGPYDSGPEDAKKAIGVDVVDPEFKRDRSDGSRWYRVPAAIVKPLQDLVTAIHHQAQSAYEEGLSRGESLLEGLATGRLSVGEFNKATLEAEERKG